MDTEVLNLKKMIRFLGLGMDLPLNVALDNVNFVIPFVLEIGKLRQSKKIVPWLLVKEINVLIKIKLLKIKDHEKSLQSIGSISFKTRGGLLRKE